jgi:hypothetical protein
MVRETNPGTAKMTIMDSCGFVATLSQWIEWSVVVVNPIVPNEAPRTAPPRTQQP